MQREKGIGRLKRRSILGAIGAAIALVASAIVPTAAMAAPPEAGTYVGTSSAYNGATFSFDVDANGVMSNFDSTSYCFDGMFTQPVTWAGGPAASVEAGQPFDLEWQIGDGTFGTYYELQGTVNADGTASGTARAGFLPSGTCGGMAFDWTASKTGGGGNPNPNPLYAKVILEKGGYYDHEIQNVGIMIRGEGFPANTDVEISILQVNNLEEVYNTVVRSDSNGEVYHRYVGWLEHQTLTGGHQLTLTAEAGSTVYTDDEMFRAMPGGDGTFQYFDGREMTVSPKSLSQSQLATSGVRIESETMDGREETAQLLVDGKHVDDVPVTAIADGFGQVAYDYIENNFPAGEHEVALRTVHISGLMNPVTWERVAWDTFTVAESPEPIFVTAEAPTRNGNTITIPSTEGVIYTDFDTDAVLTGDITLGEGQTLIIWAKADEGYMLNDGELQWSFTYEDETPVLIEVTAVSPTRDGNTVTIPEVAGVTYVDGTGTALSSTVTLTEGQPLAITANADDGYVLTEGEHRWTFTYETEAPELIEVTATAPTRDGNTVTIPVVEGVFYADSSDTVLSGTVTLTDGQTLTVTAIAEDGYVLAEGADQWSFTYEAETPVVIEVTATKPTRDGNTVTIPVIEGVIYTDGAGAELSGAITIAEGQTLTVNATAADGYVLADGAHTWAFGYETGGPSLIEVTAVAPAQDGNIVTIPTVEGVKYVTTDSAVITGSFALTEGEPITILAFAEEGYVLAVGTHDWTFTYEGGTPGLIEVTAAAPTQAENTVTIPVVEGVVYTGQAGAVLSGNVTLSEGQTLTVTAVAEDGYVLTAGTHEWTFTYEDETITDPDPGTVPAAAPVEGDLDPELEGAITAPDTVKPGESITVVIEGASEGDEVGLWFFSDPVYLGLHAVSAAGTVTVTVPAGAQVGDHKIAAWSAETEALIGWDALAVVAADPGGNDSADGNENNNGTGTATGDKSATGLATTGAANISPLIGRGALLLLAGATVVLMRRRSAAK